MPDQAARKIRIVATPAGQAPEWVRAHWIGLELPLAERCEGRVMTLTTGVLEGPPTFFGFLSRLFRGRVKVSQGFAVESNDAIAILQTKSPDAADWWRQNTPALLAARRCFLFQKEVCELV